MVVFEIVDPTVESRTVKGKNGDFQIESQNCFMFTGVVPYPRPSKVNVARDSKPKPVGFYRLSDMSFTTNQYDQIQLNPILILLTEAEVKSWQNTRNQGK